MAENSGRTIDLYDIRDFMEDAQSKLPPGMADAVTFLCDVAETAYRREASTVSGGSWHPQAQRMKNDIREMFNRIDFGDEHPVKFDIYRIHE